MSTLRTVQPPGWKAPLGYANGIVGRGRILFVGGQIGWDGQEVFVSDVLHEQFAQALDNVLAVLREAGGAPEHLARMTVYVVDKQAYRAQRKEIGRAWKARLGRHFPAMALVEVKSLLEDRAQVEIEATAVLPELPGLPG